MVAADMVLLVDSGREEGVVTAVIAVTAATAVDTTVLVVAQATLAMAMALAGNQVSHLVLDAALDFLARVMALDANLPSSRVSPAAPRRLAIMGRGSNSRMTLVQISDSSIEVQTTTTFSVMEVICSTVLGIMATISMGIIVMGTMAIDQIIINIAIVEEEIMMQGYKMVQLWLVLILSCLKKLCRGLLRHWRQQLRGEGLKE
jgi:hypothetical protein